MNEFGKNILSAVTLLMCSLSNVQAQMPKALKKNRQVDEFEIFMSKPLVRMVVGEFGWMRRKQLEK